MAMVRNSEIESQRNAAQAANKALALTKAYGGRMDELAGKVQSIFELMINGQKQNRADFQSKLAGNDGTPKA